MKEMQIRKIVLGLVCVFAINFVGCGRVGVNTIQGPKDISNYNKIYVADPNVSSREQDERSIAINAEYTKYARDALIDALKEKGTFSLLESLSSSPDSLTVETKIDLVYGSRAKRIMFFAGHGTVVCNIKLKDISSGEIKLEVESHSRLSVGRYSMRTVIEANIEQAVDEFVKEL